MGIRITVGSGEAAAAAEAEAVRPPSRGSAEEGVSEVDVGAWLGEGVSTVVAMDDDGQIC